METRVNLRRMIDLDQVENLLSNLVETVDKQQEEIENLKLLCDNFLNKGIADERFRQVQSEMEDLSIKVNRVRGSATARSNGIEFSAGELATFNNQQLQTMNATIVDLSTRTELHDVAHTIVEQHQINMKAMKEYAAPIEVTKALQQFHQDMSSRVTGIEGMVSCKLDRSELAHIEALAVRLQQYEDFRQMTVRELDRLDVLTTELKVRTEGQCHELENAEASLQIILNEIKKLAPKTETRALAKELETHTAAIQLCAKNTAVDNLNSHFMDMQVDFLEAKQLSSRLKEFTTDMNSELANKASVQDMRACVIRKHYDEAVTALGDALDGKVPHRDLQLAQNQIKTLEDELEAQNIKLSIAMRFVEW
eukprot:CAMPEP_0119049210 /NCGR_PEP_ID=MMETSP1177-20130426/63414_1 /TAXON_ID=2985 /ORGANISM="Ochromonas sp, Strain CCMP1899" /LENGTH=365 /DNA_ID=CAMNT_0007026149 /DNA_START=135 /DNA_END=1229 /DNA_ORIENTATION=+